MSSQSLLTAAACTACTFHMKKCRLPGHEYDSHDETDSDDTSDEDQDDRGGDADYVVGINEADGDNVLKAMSNVLAGSAHVRDLFPLQLFNSSIGERYWTHDVLSHLRLSINLQGKGKFYHLCV